MCIRSRESAHPVAVELQCSCSLIAPESMLFLHHNACLESNHYLQTLMTDHASHLCVRSSHQVIHYAFVLVSAVASAGRAAAIASRFFSSQKGARRLWPRIPQNWAEPEECGRRRANIGWSEPRLPNSFKALQPNRGNLLGQWQLGVQHDVVPALLEQNVHRTFSSAGSSGTCR